MEEFVERTWHSFLHRSHKLIPQHSLELRIPKPSVHKILHKKLKLHAYKIQLLHEIKAADKPRTKESAEHTVETN